MFMIPGEEEVLVLVWRECALSFSTNLTDRWGSRSASGEGLDLGGGGRRRPKRGGGQDLVVASTTRLYPPTSGWAA